MRLFVSLDLPDAVCEPLAAWRADVPGARWVPSERLHLTLRFLGETPLETLVAITGQASQIQARPVPVVAGDLIRLPSARRPRALAVRVHETAELRALAARLGAALARAGAPPADHELLPHVTLARVRQPDPAAIRKALRGRTPPEAGGLANSFSIVESRPAAGGPDYITLLRVPLAETPTAGGG
jgi:2'-5' RNA ligase